MDASSSEPSNEQQPATRRSMKRLLFDRRYGWIVDEWKDPSEEALAGGRGIFCILPMAKSLVKIASKSVDIAVNAAVKALEKPDQLYPRDMWGNLNNQFQKLMHPTKKPCASLLSFQADSTTPPPPPSCMT